MSFFDFKAFSIDQLQAPFKVGTDSVTLGSWVALDNCKTVLDIGSGTGVLALMAAQRITGKIIAIEPNPKAFKNLKINIQQSPFNKQINFVNKSLTSFSIGCNSKFEHIICNPPYFEKSVLSTNKDTAQARHQSTLSYAELFKEVKTLMSKQGKCSIVVPAKQRGNVLSKALSAHLYANRLTVVKDQKNTSPTLLLVEFRHKSNRLTMNELVIKRNSSEYSKEFRQLTADFYKSLPI